MSEVEAEIAQLMWSGDTAVLCERFPCTCCCAEHTHRYCEARLWHGCRSGLTYGEVLHEAWWGHYVKHHGWTESQFYGLDE